MSEETIVGLILVLMGIPGFLWAYLLMMGKINWTYGEGRAVSYRVKLAIGGTILFLETFAIIAGIMFTRLEI